MLPRGDIIVLGRLALHSGLKTLLPLLGFLLIGACTGPVEVTYVNSICSDGSGPALDAWMDATDTDNDGVVNSDEWNASFQRAEDQVDGQLDSAELQNMFCQ